jgi:DNA-directed RNA polymerase specialized sigma24 family protein
VDERDQALESLCRERYGTFRDARTLITRDYESARDVVQEAFATALRERRKYRGEGWLEAWMWRIAYRLALRPSNTMRSARGV